MLLDGVLVGAFTLILIGLLHLLAVKVKYHVGSRVWSLFILVGVVLVAASLVAGEELISILLGVSGFIAVWMVTFE